MNTSKRPYYFYNASNVVIATITASNIPEACKIADDHFLDYVSCTTVEPPLPPRTPGEVLDDTIDAAKATLKHAQPAIRSWLSKVLTKAGHKVAPKTTTEHGARLVQS